MSVTAAVRVAMLRPLGGRVVVGVAPLRAEPDDRSELVDEAHYGELMARLGERGEWAFVQGPDLYFGWLRTAHLAGHESPAQRVVAVPLAPVRAARSADGPIVDGLPAGAELGAPLRDGEWLRVAADRWIRADATIDSDAIPSRYPTAEDILATAEAFLGVPYLWGGTSARGIDCSGFTQRVYRLNGVGLDRDADQQALGGRAVDRALPGDLLFFGAERVTHTAIATGERTFIHAPQSGQVVQHGTLSDGSRLRAIRRYLP